MCFKPVDYQIGGHFIRNINDWAQQFNDGSAPS